jgi:mannose-6-phosphate isomerase-like protein (cupin superfamily)
MTYLGTTGEASATFIRDGEVRVLSLRATTARLVAPGSVTNGQFGLFRWDMTAGAGGASAHFHKTFSESFYVMDGTVKLYNGTKWVDARAGDFLYVPEGGAHGFHNDSDADASMMILFAPGAPREKYFEELAEIAATGRTLSTEEWIEVWARHDQYPVDQPL